MSEARIRHFLSDGREVDSIEGFVIANAGHTAAVYRIVLNHMKKCADKERNDVKKTEIA